MVRGDFWDASAWIGSWPFDGQGPCTLPRLQRLLGEAGIAGGVISPLGAVLATDPAPANRALLPAVRRAGPGWVAAPVINPALGDWEAETFRCLRQGARGVRLVPSYHLYPLEAAGLPRFEALAVSWVPRAARDALDGLDGLCRLAAAEAIPVAVQMRVSDERAHHPWMRVPGVPPAEVAALARRHPDGRFVACGATFGDLEVLGAVDNVWVEVSFVEASETLIAAVALVRPERVLLGTHAPMFYPAVAVAKVGASDLPEAVRLQIAGGNARDLWAV